MRLINTATLDVEYFVGADIPEYAILSHTWEEEEVTYQEWANRSNVSKTKGYQKIASACELAREDGHRYLWVDTNCIDKTSSAELTEAINSMFEWYGQSNVCYAYLSDVETYKPLTGTTEIRRSRWFRRGWTLQELLAPRDVLFYAADWSKLGTRTTLARHVSAATGIALKYLGTDAPVHTASVAERMSWLARRQTTRVEDMAYCALGIFGIHMPLVYGEGQRAFVRLQEEILRVSADQSLFCWSWGPAVIGRLSHVGLLSPHPQAFLEAGRYAPHFWETITPRPYAMTNAGLSISLPLATCWRSYICVLGVATSGSPGACIGIAMSGSPSVGRFARRNYPNVPIPTAFVSVDETRTPQTNMFIPMHKQAVEQLEKGLPVTSPSMDQDFRCRGGVLLSFSPRRQFAHICTFPSGRFNFEDSILEIWQPRDTAGDLEDAVVIEFERSGSQKETFVIAMSSFPYGDVAHAQWYLSGAGDARSWRGIPESLQRMVASRLDGMAEFGISMGESTQLAVSMASEGFLTMDGSILKHVHVAVRDSVDE